MKDYPIIKVAIVLVAGILSARFIELGILPLLTSFILLVAMVLFYKQKNDKVYYQLLILIFSAILIFTAGNILAGMSKNNFNPALTSIDKIKNTTVVGEITKIDLKRNDELTFYLAADSIYSDEFIIKDELNILCKIKGDQKRH